MLTPRSLQCILHLKSIAGGEGQGYFDWDETFPCSLVPRHLNTEAGSEVEGYFAHNETNTP